MILLKECSVGDFSLSEVLTHRFCFSGCVSLMITASLFLGVRQASGTFLILYAH